MPDDNRMVGTILDANLPVEVEQPLENEIDFYRDQLDAITQQELSFGEVLSQEYEALPFEAQEGLGEISTKYCNGEITLEEAAEAFSHKGLSSNGINAFTQLLEGDKRKAEIDQKLVPLEYQAFGLRVSRILDSIDWDSVFSYFSDSENVQHQKNLARDGIGGSLSEFVHSRLFELRNYKDKYSQSFDPNSVSRDLLNRDIRNLDAFEEGLKETKLLKEPDEDILTVEEIPQVEALKDIEGVLQSFKDLNLCSLVYRAYLADIPPQEINTAQTGLSLVQEAISRGERVPSSLLATVKSKWVDIYDRTFAKVFSEGSNLSEHREMSIDDRIAAIPFEGFDTYSTGDVVLVTEEHVKEWIRSIPSAFLSKIGKIKATTEESSSIPAIRSLDSNKIIPDVGGSFIQEYGADDHLENGIIELYLPTHVDPKISLDTQQVIIREFEQTVYHEVFHRVHHGLSLEQMRRWTNIHSDGVSVTNYVKSKRKQDGISISLKEDFCESAMIFIYNPGVLYKQSQERFEYMLSLFLENIPEDARIDFIEEKILAAYMYNNLTDKLEESANSAVRSIIN